MKWWSRCATVSWAGCRSRQIKDYEGDVIVDVNQEINEDLAAAIQAAGIERVKIRSVLTCESKRGVCVRCYGRNLATGRVVEMGEAVGVIGAQSIGEPGTQLTMRTFHIGGTASRISEQSRLEAKNHGFLKFHSIQTVMNREGAHVVMNRNGAVAIVDEKGRERERYSVVYGARIKAADGAPVKMGDIVVEWDPYTFSILTEVSGTVQFKDLDAGITLQEQVDEVTGLSQWVVKEATDEKFQPQIVIRNEKKGTKKYLMPSRAHLMVQEGDEVSPGDALAKIPRETTKTKDITGGLPRVVELFERANLMSPQLLRKSMAWFGTATSSKVSERFLWSPTKVKPRNTCCRAACTSRCRKVNESMLAHVWTGRDGPNSSGPRREGITEVSRR